MSIKTKAFRNNEENQMFSLTYKLHNTETKQTVITKKS